MNFLRIIYVITFFNPLSLGRNFPSRALFRNLGESICPSSEKGIHVGEYVYVFLVFWVTLSRRKFRDNFFFCTCIYSLFLKFIYFNWMLITLQYCGGFCHTLTWISHGCTCIPPSQIPLSPPSPSHLSGFSQCTSFEFPVSCIKLGLVIYFTYFTILFLSNHPTLTFSQSPKFCSLYLCSFCCLAYRVIITIVLNSIYMC